jgi:Rrf2 family protein
MRINQKVKYAVACLFELALSPMEFLDATTLAFARNIPPAYAHKVLQNLARAGLVIALKGVGYRLARPLADITVLQVMEALASDTVHESVVPELGLRLEKRVNEALGHCSLAELKGR